MTAPVIDRAAWTIVTHPRGDYLRAEVGEATLYADVHLSEAELAVRSPLTADESKTLAVLLVEAAAFLDGGPA